MGSSRAARRIHALLRCGCPCRPAALPADPRPFSFVFACPPCRASPCPAPPCPAPLPSPTLPCMLTPHRPWCPFLISTQPPVFPRESMGREGGLLEEAHPCASCASFPACKLCPSGPGQSWRPINSTRMPPGPSPHGLRGFLRSCPRSTVLPPPTHAPFHSVLSCPSKPGMTRRKIFARCVTRDGVSFKGLAFRPSTGLVLAVAWSSCLGDSSVWP